MVEFAVPVAQRRLGDNNAAFTVVEWLDSGESNEERPIAPPHIHDAGEEAWYVLDGRLGVRVGDRTVVADAGGGVLVPRGIAHTFWNAGDRPCRYLVVMTPEIYRLIESLHDPSLDRSRESLDALFASHQSRLL